MRPAHLRLVGLGLYTRADAVRLLRMTPSRVSRWVMGYSYTPSYAPKAERRAQPPVVRARIPRIDGSILISFLDLMELRVVKALIDRGLSLQHVRQSKLAERWWPLGRSVPVVLDPKIAFESRSRLQPRPFNLRRRMSPLPCVLSPSSPPRREVSVRRKHTTGRRPSPRDPWFSSVACSG